MINRPAGKQSLLSLASLSTEQIESLAERSREFASQFPTYPPILKGRLIGIYFKKTSTRTRTGFSSAALRLGGQLLTFGPSDLQVNTGETLEDTGRVLSGMIDVLVARTAEPVEDMVALTSNGRLSVINAMSREEHPTQAIADLGCILETFGDLRPRKILYVGEGNNTASALAIAISKLAGWTLELRTPSGFGLDREYSRLIDDLSKHSGARVSELHDMEGIESDFDLVYTTRWETTGTAKPIENWRDLFEPFRVSERVFAQSGARYFMHDLPAHRGDEVVAPILDSTNAIAFRQANYKMFGAMAVLEWCLNQE